MRFIHIFILLAIAFSCSEKSDSRITGSWKVKDLIYEGSRHDMRGDEMHWLNIIGDGTYQSGFGNSEMVGRWGLSANTLLLISPEVKDLNGNLVSPKNRTQWTVSVSDKLLFLEGTSDFDNQKMKIVLERDEQIEN